MVMAKVLVTSEGAFKPSFMPLVFVDSSSVALTPFEITWFGRGWIVGLSHPFLICGKVPPCLSGCFAFGLNVF